MVKSKHDSDGYSDIDKKDTIEKLKAANRRLVKDNKKLKAEMATLEAAFSKTEHLLRNSVKGKSLESIMKSLMEEGVLPENNDMPEEFIEPIIEAKKCSNCGSKDLKIVTSTKSILTICNDCSHRNVDKEFKDEFDMSPVGSDE